MKNLRQRFNRFCFHNRNKGIDNLMLYVTLGGAAVYIMGLIDPSMAVYRLLMFDRDAIFAGQIWRLVTYPLCVTGGNPALTLFFLFCTWSLARGVENSWGSFKFNLYYFFGLSLTTAVGLVFGFPVTAGYLHTSLFLAYATLYPDSKFLILFIIPIPAWVLALIDLFWVFIGLLDPFPFNLIPVISLGNYFLFFGKDCLNVLPISWRVNARRAVRKAAAGKKHKTIPFNAAGSYQATHASVKAPYRHKCTVCGKTDLDDPNLEFRYCSRCKGYYCYCSEHISNHVHITD